MGIMMSNINRTYILGTWSYLISNNGNPQTATTGAIRKKRITPLPTVIEKGYGVPGCTKA